MDPGLPYGDPPTPTPGIDSVEIDGERVLYHHGTGTVARLDRVGSIIWPFLDGKATVADLATDLGAAFEVAVADARAGLDGLLRDLAGRGLVEPGARGR